MIGFSYQKPRMKRLEINAEDRHIVKKKFVMSLETMMVSQILDHYGMQKADALLADFTAAVFDFDPNHASRAEIAFMQAELNTLADRLAKFETEAQLKFGETEELQQTYHRYLYAARALQHELDQIGNTGRHADIEMSLVKLVDQLERLHPELAQEQDDDRVFAAWTSHLRSSVETLIHRLRQAQSDLPSTIQRSNHQEPSGRLTAASALTSALSAISVALDSMNGDAAKIRAERKAFEHKLERVRSDRLEHDPNIAAVLGTRSPWTSVDGRSLRERLARLESPTAGVPASAA